MRSPVSIIILLCLITAVAPAKQPPHAWDCFQVDSITTDRQNSTYEVKAHNKCDEPLSTVILLVKYLDKDGNRIGVGAAFSASYVAAHEKLRREVPILDVRQQTDPFVLKNVRSVQVRAIREDLSEELR